MNIEQLITKIRQQPEAVEFNEVMAVITSHYHYSATDFNNADLINKAGMNEGSCKIFAFAQLNELSQAQTLACFGQYYRDDVLKHPDATDHGNIRRFIQHGWTAISFDNPVLTPR